jgi:hypothetical protein
MATHTPTPTAWRPTAPNAPHIATRTPIPSCVAIHDAQRIPDPHRRRGDSGRPRQLKSLAHPHRAAWLSEASSAPQIATHTPTPNCVATHGSRAPTSPRTRPPQAAWRSTAAGALQTATRTPIPNCVATHGSQGTPNRHAHARLKLRGDPRRPAHPIPKRRGDSGRPRHLKSSRTPHRTAWRSAAPSRPQTATRTPIPSRVATHGARCTPHRHPHAHPKPRGDPRHPAHSKPPRAHPSQAAWLPTAPNAPHIATHTPTPNRVAIHGSQGTPHRHTRDAWCRWQRAGGPHTGKPPRSAGARNRRARSCTASCAIA